MGYARHALILVNGGRGRPIAFCLSQELYIAEHRPIVQGPMARIQVGKVAGVIQQSPTLAVVVSLGLRAALLYVLTPTTVTAEGPYSYSCSKRGEKMDQRVGLDADQIPTRNSLTLCS